MFVILATLAVLHAPEFQVQIVPRVREPCSFQVLSVFQAAPPIHLALQAQTFVTAATLHAPPVAHQDLQAA